MMSGTLAIEVKLVMVALGAASVVGCSWFAGLRVSEVSGMKLSRTPSTGRCRASSEDR